MKEMDAGDRRVFVDTNSSIDMLRKIASPERVLVMLADPEVSVRRFFEPLDREKQYLDRPIMEGPEPGKALGPGG